MEGPFETIRMYFKLIGIALKGMLQYRADFLTGAIGVIVSNGARLLTIGVLLTRFFDLAGWTIWEIVFLYGFWMAGNSIYSLLFFHVVSLEDYIVEGTFDRFLLRPLSPLLQLLTVNVDYNGIGDSLFGIIAMSLGASYLNLHFGPLQWIFMLVMLLSAALLELGLTLALASIAFWTSRSAGLVFAINSVNWGMTQQYPLEVFGRAFRILVTTLVPVAFINYYPARFLLGKIAPGDPGYFLSFMSPVAALVLLGIAWLVWSNGIRHYNSTGS